MANLVLKNVNHDNIEVHLSITTHYLSVVDEPLNIFQQIKVALIKRTSYEHKTIDLTNFSRDDCIQEVFFHLDIPQCLNHALGVIKNVISYKPVSASTEKTLCTLNLQHNQLKDLGVLDLKGLTSIKHIDLRNNKLDWDGFKKLIRFDIRRTNVDSAKDFYKFIESLWLAGNPLCSDTSEEEYIKGVLYHLPYLKQLDGVEILNYVDPGPPTLKNYIIDAAWSGFIDHFLHHYFGLMESPNRYQLIRMYHPKANFSFSASHCPSELYTDWKTLCSFTAQSRNLLTLSDINKALPTLKVGQEDIIDSLNMFPVVQFDPYSFTVDVPYCKKNEVVVINVTGTFQELRSAVFYFERSFVLTHFSSGHSGEWKITNDMMTIMIAGRQQTERFMSTSANILSREMKLTLNPNTKDKETLIPAVCEHTKLTKEWAIRFLEEGSWDLERTLQAFIDQFKSNQIPLSAFSI